MENAKKLLTETGLSLLEIMARCGYADQRRFCRKFREYTGMPPPVNTAIAAASLLSEIFSRKRLANILFGSDCNHKSWHSP